LLFKDSDVYGFR